MYRYLDAITPDYDYTLLVSPTTILPNMIDRPQIVYNFVDGRSQVQTITGKKFEVELQWNYISDADRSTILDLYHDSAKANGLANTFYWDHPREDQYYVVRFLGPLKTSYVPGNLQSIETVRLRVEGYYDGSLRIISEAGAFIVSEAGNEIIVEG